MHAVYTVEFVAYFMQILCWSRKHGSGYIYKKLPDKNFRGGLR